MVDYEKLEQIVGNLDEEGMIEILNQVMEDGGTSASEAMTACQKGMDEVGRLFQTGEYFVSDLVFAGEMMTTAVDILKPALAKDSGSGCGKLIICTVEGDLHDIGKNIVKAMLEAGGFEVIDLGIDTPAEKVVEIAKKESINIVALSGVLTLAITGMKKTIEKLKTVDPSIKVIVGGCPVNDAVAKEVGADAWAYNPQDTVRICQGWAK